VGRGPLARDPPRGLILAAGRAPGGLGAMDVVVVATFEDFDETLDKRLRGPRYGRRRATQALVHHLAQQPEDAIRKVDLLVLDWKSPPKQGPKEVQVSLGHGGDGTREAVWGSRDQLIAKYPASVWDVVICTQTRRLVLDFAAMLKSRRRLAMAHDYDLPFGPWGQEQTSEQLQEHCSICEKFELLCSSRHLTEFVEKWGEGRFRSRCCYAADYGYFDPVPAALSPWEARHEFVTLVSPSPEKGLCILLRLAEAMPDVKFLAVKTVAHTKPWHEQLLKRLQNVTVKPATERIDEVLGLTKVLIAPSVGQEAFGYTILEAQLRGIPVVSTGSCGLAESNRVPATAVDALPIVYDQRAHELVLGMTMEEAESSLPADRPGSLTMEQWRQTAVMQEGYQKVADESDAAHFVSALRLLLEKDSGALQQASQDARLAADAFVEGRRGALVPALQELLKGCEDVKPTAAIAAPAPKFAPRPRDGQEWEEDDSFDVNRDFTQDPEFDGMKLAARLLVRMCEAGNLTVSAELIQAKADVDMPEPEIGVTPLVAAANSGHVDICKYLFRKGASVNSEVQDGTGRVALHAAAQMGYASVVQLLLEQRADPRVADLVKATPLHLAARYGHCGALELLIKAKANPNQADESGHVPINDGVAKDRFDIVTKLLEHGAIVNVRNMAGLEAISFSRTPAMQALIMKNDVNF